MIATMSAMAPNSIRPKPRGLGARATFRGRVWPCGRTPPRNRFTSGEVAYCKCDVEFGESVSLALEYDKDKNVCTINEKGVKKGLYDKHFQRAPVEPPAHSDDVGRAFRLISATCSDRSRPAVPIDVGRGGGAPAGRY
jgi:hypothetical protein